MLARQKRNESHWAPSRVLRKKYMSAVRKVKSAYYSNLIFSTYSDCATFLNFDELINSYNDKTSASLPAHIKSNDCLISDRNEICFAFKKHFATDFFEEAACNII